MEKAATRTDAVYEDDLRTSEQAFLRSYAEWLHTLTGHIERLPIPVFSKDGQDVIAETLGLERVERDIFKRPPVSAHVVSRLAKACRDYAAFGLSAYARFLQRKEMANSQAVSESKEHAKVVLEETRRKWDYGISQISEVFDSEAYAQDTWNSIASYANMFQMEIVEPGLWFGATPQTKRSTITEALGLAAQPNIRKRGPKRDFKSAVQVAEVVARVAPDGDWRSKLDDIGEALDHGVCTSGVNTCPVLDHEKIPIPRTWRGKHNNWLNPPDRPTMVKAIEYRLKIASGKPI